MYTLGIFYTALYAESDPHSSTYLSLLYYSYNYTTDRAVTLHRHTQTQNAAFVLVVVRTCEVASLYCNVMRAFRCWSAFETTLLQPLLLLLLLCWSPDTKRQL
jgi:hypothetical protein